MVHCVVKSKYVRLFATQAEKRNKTEYETE